MNAQSPASHPLLEEPVADAEAGKPPKEFSTLPGVKTGLSKMHQRVLDKKAGKEMLPSNLKAATAQNYWDEAERAYQIARQGVQGVFRPLADFLTALTDYPDIKLEMEQIPGLADNITLLARDVQDTLNALAQIHQQHEGRTGTCTSGDDTLLLFRINGEYQDRMEIFNGTTGPTAESILEKTRPLELKIRELNQQKAG